MRCVNVTGMYFKLDLSIMLRINRIIIWIIVHWELDVAQITELDIGIADVKSLIEETSSVHIRNLGVHVLPFIFSYSNSFWLGLDSKSGCIWLVHYIGPFMFIHVHGSIIHSICVYHCSFVDNISPYEMDEIFKILYQMSRSALFLWLDSSIALCNSNRMVVSQSQTCMVLSQLVCHVEFLE